MWVRDRKTDELWIQTASGRRIDLPAPDLSQIHLADIAIGLAREGRYSNQTDFRWIPAYSVAQHVVHCSRVCDPEYAWDCLMHDSAEAYLGDVPAPFKKMLRQYQVIERRFMQVLSQRFQFRWPLPEVKRADTIAFVTERRDLMEKPPSPWSPLKVQVEPDRPTIRVWSTSRAYREFLRRVAELRPDLDLTDVPHSAKPVEHALRAKLRRRGQIEHARNGLAIRASTRTRNALRAEFGDRFAGFPLRYLRG